MRILITYFALGRNGLRLLDWIVKRYENKNTVDVREIESLEKHGFHGWLLRSMVPGFSTMVRPVDLVTYDLIFLVSPKWAYNCPVINGAVEGAQMQGKKFVVIVTYSKGDPTGYVKRLCERITGRGGQIIDKISVSRSEISEGRFLNSMEEFHYKLEAKIPSLSARGAIGQAQSGFAFRLILVFWETTRACLLSCVHCRASAITEPLPGELTKEEGLQLIDQIGSFGKPYPTIVFTGGDPLKRGDLLELMSHAASRGIEFAVAPSVTEFLTWEILKQIRLLGASSISISLDGAFKETHDAIRGRGGTYDRTMNVIKNAISLGLNLQVNTAVMKRNLAELPKIFHLIRSLRVRTWEVFFLIKVGRGNQIDDLTPEEYESVCNFLYDASFYEVTIRCVEAPFIRRISRQRIDLGSYWDDGLYEKLRSDLLELDGRPADASTLRPRGTLDGDGIIFVAHEGTIFPGGFLPVAMGNVRTESLARVYREDKLLKNIRNRELRGYCGVCEFREICGGSRARAYSYYGDPLSTDPACVYGTKHVS